MNKMINIKSGEKNYSVTITNKKSLQSELNEISQNYRKVFILVDSRVKELYPSVLDFDNYEILELEATEDQKSFHSLDIVLDFYISVGLQKKDLVVALGGGIIQDIVALTTKIYWRGVDYCLIPTTLLSMSDSSIGAKCGINYRDKKNQIAVFSSPVSVIQNLNFLQTLDHKDIVSGIGEIVKLLITSSMDDFEFLERNIDAALENTALLDDLIYKALLSKKLVIEEDEYESDLRRVLNYGHTFGHAVESLSKFTIPHGTAVLWGMDLVNFISVRRGLMSVNDYQRINKLINKIYQISSIRGYDATALVDFVKNDKKVVGTKINMVYPSSIGHLQIVPIEIDESLILNVKEYFEK